MIFSVFVVWVCVVCVYECVNNICDNNVKFSKRIVFIKCLLFASFLNVFRTWMLECYIKLNLIKENVNISKRQEFCWIKIREICSKEKFILKFFKVQYKLLFLNTRLVLFCNTVTCSIIEFYSILDGSFKYFLFPSISTNSN